MDSVIYNTKNATINFYNIIYKFNHEQLDLILNSKINFKLYKDNKYVCFSNTNNKIITILEFLFKLKIEHHIYKFKDNDEFNLKSDNILIDHKEHIKITNKYGSAEYFQGHYQTTGNDAYIIKNPYLRVR